MSLCVRVCVCLYGVVIGDVDLCIKKREKIGKRKRRTREASGLTSGDDVNDFSIPKKK